MVTIYGLVNVVTGSVYVGCTAGKLSKRMREHRCLLNGQRHTAKQMQRDWQQYGQSGFRMIVLEALDNDVGVIEKRERELHWMKKMKEQGKLYNEFEISFGPPKNAPALAAKARVANGYSPTPESNLKRRLAQLGKPKGHGAKISATKQAKNRL
jgi:group I intron endonuclease